MQWKLNKYVSQKVRKNRKKSNINSMKAEERKYQGKDVNQQTRATDNINKKYVFFKRLIEFEIPDSDFQRKQGQVK